MKKIVLISAAVLLWACSNEQKSSSVDSNAVELKGEKVIDTAAMNKAWADYMTPGDVHKMLASTEGKWNAEIAFYYSPDSPSVSKLTCENKMILGGRYQQSMYEGSIEGMPFEGINTLAYDNAKKIYISTWIDNMGTGVMHLEGKYDEASKKMHLQGKATDVVSGQPINVREVFTFVDKDTQLMEMFEEKNGKEMKTMSISLKRAK
ncbi:MAG: DUF1579 domain-containing protein [Pedobacter sp.]|nr:MAG: DUF1579 domain-containing protein [Pedobacter sp.]